MGKEKKVSVGVRALTILTVLLLFVAVGCRKEETVITARFTDPVDVQPQASGTCIACHTQKSPIVTLARPVSAAAETGG
ncbi:MAG: hypothetical protein ACOX0W_05110 [Sphaerochaetaceae bacterium]|jgi:hypothetical protein